MKWLTIAFKLGLRFRRGRNGNSYKGHQQPAKVKRRFRWGPPIRDSNDITVGTS